MAANDIAGAIERVKTIMARRPEVAVQANTPTTARWEGGLRASATHETGLRVETDMPGELGGTGDRPSPGWLLRAGASSCAVIRIAMEAASAGVVLDTLEVRAESRSDARGLLALAGDDGRCVPAGPLDVVLRVRIAATGVSEALLRALVDSACRCAPVQQALAQATPVEVQVDIGMP